MKALFFFLLLCGLAYADVTCDPQADVTEYGLACDGNITMTVPANPDGSMNFVSSTWTGDTGWVNCIVVACKQEGVIDDATGVETSGMICSDPATFQMRVPRSNQPGNWRVK